MVILIADMGIIQARDSSTVTNTVQWLQLDTGMLAFD
jgi:hypothetical protein